jgi:hypothetical protein
MDSKEFMYQRYNEECRRISDINEHLPVLQKYARECSTVAECGVRSIVSTWALMSGLYESEGENKKMFCVDLEEVDMSVPKKIAGDLGIDLTFIKNDSAKVEFGTNVDMLFIDTWHIYGHLKRELAHHHERVNKYIVMHDTTLDEYSGETVRAFFIYKNAMWDPYRQSAATGYPVEEIIKGLRPAIEEFLEEHPEWVVEQKLTNNNGLTVLTKVNSK